MAFIIARPIHMTEAVRGQFIVGSKHFRPSIIAIGRKSLAGVPMRCPCKDNYLQGGHMDIPTDFVTNIAAYVRRMQMRHELADWASEQRRDRDADLLLQDGDNDYENIVAKTDLGLSPVTAVALLDRTDILQYFVQAMFPNDGANTAAMARAYDVLRAWLDAVKYAVESTDSDCETAVSAGEVLYQRLTGVPQDYVLTGEMLRSDYVAAEVLPQVPACYITFALAVLETVMLPPEWIMRIPAFVTVPPPKEAVAAVAAVAAVETTTAVPEETIPEEAPSKEEVQAVETSAAPVQQEQQQQQQQEQDKPVQKPSRRTRRHGQAKAPAVHRLAHTRRRYSSS
jgi:hypothetical protein